MDFDLERAVGEWRRAFRRYEAFDEGAVEELECHLRDEVEALVGKGVPVEEAFGIAAAGIGPAEEIGGEYWKVRSRRLAGGPPWRSRGALRGLLPQYVRLLLRRFLREKVYSAINLLGLAVGMACCILLFLWVRDELSFDRFHERGGDIYRVIAETRTQNRISRMARTPNPLGPELARRYPEVAGFVRFQGFDGWPVRVGEKQYDDDWIACADPGFFEIFSFPFLRGDPATAIDEPHTIVISESMARKYFGDEDPMGKTINIHHDFTVTGVIEDVPDNSHLHFDCLFPIVQMQYFWHEDFTDWGRTWYYLYLLLDGGADPARLAGEIGKVMAEHHPGVDTKIILQPMRDVHLRSDFAWDLDNYRQGHILYVYLFSAAALCILLIACVNYTNLSTARAARRAGEVGMRKIVGASRGDLARQHLGESVLVSIAAALLALLLAQLALPAVNGLAGKELTLSPSADWRIPTGLILITLVTGLLAGIYPALYLSSIEPVRIFKTGVGFRSARGGFRKTLVLFQFALALVLVICTTAIYRQLVYIQEKDLGFDTERVVVFDMGHAPYHELKTRLLEHPGVLRVTGGNVPGDDLMGMTGFEWEGMDGAEGVMLYPVMVDFDYLETFGMEMKAGRFFSREFPADSAGAAVINETAARAMGLEDPVGVRVSHERRDATIIGVIRDFNHTALRNEIEPMIFYLSAEDPRVCALLDPAGMPGAIAHIQETCESYARTSPFSYQFLDERIGTHYSVERKIGTIFRSFTALAIFVACLGLFGLASFTAERRTKEIGVRKVLGAPVSSIVTMLAREFTLWVLLANAIAWPVAYHLVLRWLDRFAFHVGVSPLWFAAAGAGTLAIALLSVTAQALRCAHADPVKTLRYE